MSEPTDEQRQALIPPEVQEWLKEIDPQDQEIFLEYYLLHRFPTLQITDELYYFNEVSFAYPGRLLERYASSAGLLIYIYEHAIMVGVGERGFSGESNYGRMIKSIYDVYEKYLPRVLEERRWGKFAFIGTHLHLEEMAWAIAKTMNLPVSELIKTDYAEELLVRLSSHKVSDAWLKSVPPTPTAR